MIDRPFHRGLSCRRVLLCLGVALVTCWGICAPSVAWGSDESAIADWPVEAPGAVPIDEGIPALDGLLFIGTSENVNDPMGTANDVFAVDPGTEAATSILTAVGVWGATADPANQRILFTRASGLEPPPAMIGGGDELLSVPYGGGAVTSLGRIVDAAGEGFRIDGLAMSGGVLYGVAATNNVNNGFYSIDLGTFVATAISLYTDSISGLDADPDTGIIYGVNDTAGMLMSFATDGTQTDVAPYPAGLIDVDGLAVGNGMAYLVADRPEPIAVYDLTAGTFGPTINSPFTIPDTFSGAAIAVEGGGPLVTDGFESGDTTSWSSEQP